MILNFCDLITGRCPFRLGCNFRDEVTRGIRLRGISSRIGVCRLSILNLWVKIQTDIRYI